MDIISAVLSTKPFCFVHEPLVKEQFERKFTGLGAWLTLFREIEIAAQKQPYLMERFLKALVKVLWAKNPGNKAKFSERKVEAPDFVLMLRNAVGEYISPSLPRGH